MTNRAEPEPPRIQTPPGPRGQPSRPALLGRPVAAPRARGCFADDCTRGFENTCLFLPHHRNFSASTCWSGQVAVEACQPAISPRNPDWELCYRADPSGFRVPKDLEAILLNSQSGSAILVMKRSRLADGEFAIPFSPPHRGSGVRQHVG